MNHETGKELTVETIVRSNQYLGKDEKRFGIDYAAHFLILDSQGSIYISAGDKIAKYPIGGPIETFAGTTKGYKDGTRQNCCFFGPRGMWLIDESDGPHMLMVDSENNVIREIQGDDVTTWAGVKKEGHKDGPRLSALFKLPQQIVGARGNYFISDMLNSALRMVNADGIVSTIGVRHDSLKFGHSGQMSFCTPKALALLDNNRLLVASNTKGQVSMLDLVTMTLTNLAGSGKGCSDGDASRATFSCIYSAYVMPDASEVLFADHYNHSIRKLDLISNRVSKLLGDGVQSALDGLISCAGSNEPVCATYSPIDGSLYILEWCGILRIIRGYGKPAERTTPKTTRLTSWHWQKELFAHWQNALLSDLKFQISDQQDPILLHTGLLHLSGITETHLKAIQEDPGLHKFARDFLEIVYGGYQPVSSEQDPERAATLLQALYVSTKLNVPQATEWLQRQVHHCTVKLSITQFVPLLLEIAQHLELSHACVHAMQYQCRRYLKDLQEEPMFMEFSKHSPSLQAQLMKLLNDQESMSLGSLELLEPTADCIAYDGVLNFGTEKLAWTRWPATGPSTSSTSSSLDSEDSNKSGSFKKLVDAASSNFNPEDCTNFSLVINNDLSEEQKLQLRVHDFVVYSKWSFFRRLLESGMEETRSKVVTFPSDFPSDLLLHIVSYCYSGSCDLSRMSIQGAAFVFTEGVQYGLVDFDRKATPEFGSFVQACQQRLLPHLCLETCAWNFRSHLLMGSPASAIAATAHFIDVHRHQLPASPDTTLLLEEVSKYL